MQENQTHDLGSETSLPTVIFLRGKRSEAKGALALVIDRQTDLLEAWRRIHGTH